MELENKKKILYDDEQLFVTELKHIVYAAKKKAYTAIDFAQVEANWLIGKRRADYGKFMTNLLFDELTKEFGKGFSNTNIKNFKNFYLLFPHLGIGQTPSDLLTWTMVSNQLQTPVKKLC